MAATRYAFKCANCGVLETPEIAGEDQPIPAACRVCGKGITRDPETGAWKADPDNWIVLADLPDDELKEHLDYHGIEQGDIVSHRVSKEAREAFFSRVPAGTHVRVEAEDGAGTADLA